jgi:hypothetical protein
MCGRNKRVYCGKKGAILDTKGVDERYSVRKSLAHSTYFIRRIEKVCTVG